VWQDGVCSAVATRPGRTTRPRSTNNPFLVTSTRIPSGTPFRRSCISCSPATSAKDEIHQQDLFRAGGVVGDHLLRARLASSPSSPEPRRAGAVRQGLRLARGTSASARLVVYLQAPIGGTGLATQAARRRCTSAAEGLHRKGWASVPEFFFPTGQAAPGVNLRRFDFVESRADLDDLVAVIHAPEPASPTYSPLGTR